MRLRNLIWLLLCASLFGACKKELPDTEPEGAVQAFAAALLESDADRLWFYISDDSKQLFIDAWDDLEEMDEMLSYMQASERPEIREQAGLALLEQLDGPQGLFEYLVQADSIAFSERHARGLEISEILDESAESITYTSRSEQTLTLSKGEDGVWRVDSPMRELFASRLAPISESYENLRLRVTLFGQGANAQEELRRYGFLPPEEPESDDSAGAESAEPDEGEDDSGE